MWGRECSTDREREILDLIARGCDNPTIARRLILSERRCATTCLRVCASCKLLPAPKPLHLLATPASAPN
jgi:hypothetical protein